MKVIKESSLNNISQYTEVDPSTNIVYDKETGQPVGRLSNTGMSREDIKLMSDKLELTPAPEIGYGDSKYDEGFTLTPYSTAEELNEYRAAKQGGLDKTGNALAQLFANAATTVVDDWVGTAYGIGQGVLGKRDFLTDYVNNDVSTWLNDVRKWTMKEFPIYASKESEDEIFTTEALGNMLATTLASAGYALGSFVGGAGVAKGLTKLIKPKNISMALADALTSKTGTKEIGEALGKVAKNELPSSAVIDAVIEAGKVAKSSPRAVATQLSASLLGTQGEARMEAINNREEYLQKMLPEAQRRASDKALERLKEFPREDPTVAYDKLYKEELAKETAKLEDNANNVSKLSHALNTLVLSASSMVQFGKSLKPNYAIQKTIDKNLIKGSIKEGFELGKRDIFQRVSPYLAGASEFGEEVAQGGIGALGESYYESKYKTGDGNLSKAIDDSVDKMISIPSLKEGISGLIIGSVGMPTRKTNVTKRATYDENGELISPEETKTSWGMAGGIFDALAENKEVINNTKQLIDYKNKFIEQHKEDLEYLNRAANLNKEKKDALAKDDKFTYKTLEDDELVNLATKAINGDSFQELIDSYKGFTNVSEEDAAWIRDNSKQRPNDKSKTINETYQEKLNNLENSILKVNPDLQQLLIKLDSNEELTKEEQALQETAKPILDKYIQDLNKIKQDRDKALADNFKTRDKDAKDLYSDYVDDKSLANHINETNQKVVDRLKKINEQWTKLNNVLPQDINKNTKELLLRNLYQANRYNERLKDTTKNLKDNLMVVDVDNFTQLNKDLVELNQKEFDAITTIAEQIKIGEKKKELETIVQDKFKEIESITPKVEEISAKKEELQSNISDNLKSYQDSIGKITTKLGEKNEELIEKTSQFQSQVDTINEEMNKKVELLSNLNTLVGKVKGGEWNNEDISQLNTYLTEVNKLQKTAHTIEDLSRNPNTLNYYASKIKDKYNEERKQVEKSYKSDAASTKGSITKLTNKKDKELAKLSNEEQQELNELNQYLAESNKALEELNKNKKELLSEYSNSKIEINNLVKESEKNTEKIERLNKEHSDLNSSIQNKIKEVVKKPEFEGKTIREIESIVVDNANRISDLNKQLEEEQRINYNFKAVEKDLADVQKLIRAESEFNADLINSINNPSIVNSMIESREKKKQEEQEKANLDKEIKRITDKIKPGFIYGSSSGVFVKKDKEGIVGAYEINEEGKLKLIEPLVDDNILTLGDLKIVDREDIKGIKGKLSTKEGLFEGHLMYEPNDQFRQLVEKRKKEEELQKVNLEDESNIPTPYENEIDEESKGVKQQISSATELNNYTNISEEEAADVESVYDSFYSTKGKKPNEFIPNDNPINQKEFDLISNYFEAITGQKLEDVINENTDRKGNFKYAFTEEQQKNPKFKELKGKVYGRHGKSVITGTNTLNLKKHKPKKPYKTLMLFQYAGKKKDGTLIWKHPKGTNKWGRLWGEKAKEVKFIRNVGNDTIEVMYQGEKWYAKAETAKFIDNPNKAFQYIPYKESWYTKESDGRYSYSKFKGGETLYLDEEEFKNLPRLTINGKPIEDKTKNVNGKDVTIVTTPQPKKIKDSATNKYKLDFQVPADPELKKYEILQDNEDSYVIKNGQKYGRVLKDAKFIDYNNKVTPIARWDISKMFTSENEEQDTALAAETLIIEDPNTSDEVESSEAKQINFKIGLLNQTRTHIGTTSKEEPFIPSTEVDELWKNVLDKKPNAIENFQNHHTVRSQNWINTTKNLSDYTLTVFRGKQLGFTDENKKEGLFGVVTNKDGKFIVNSWNKDTNKYEETAVEIPTNDSNIVVQPLGLPKNVHNELGVIYFNAEKQHKDESEHAKNEVDRYANLYKSLEIAADAGNPIKLNISKKITGRSIRGNERTVVDVYKEDGLNDFSIDVVTSNKPTTFEGIDYKGNPGEVLLYNNTTGNVHYVKSRYLNDNDSNVLIKLLEKYVSNFKFDNIGNIDLENTSILEIEGNTFRLEEALNNIIYTQNKNNLNNDGRIEYNRIKDAIKSLEKGNNFNRYNDSIPLDVVDKASYIEYRESYDNLLDELNDLLINTPKELEQIHVDKGFYFKSSDIKGGELVIDDRTVTLLNQEVLLKEGKIQLNPEIPTLIKEFVKGRRNQVRASYLNHPSEKHYTLEVEGDDLKAVEYDNYESYLWKKVLTTTDLDNKNFLDKGVTIPTHLNQYLTFTANKDLEQKIEPVKSSKVNESIGDENAISDYESKADAVQSVDYYANLIDENISKIPKNAKSLKIAPRQEVTTTESTDELSLSQMIAENTPNIIASKESKSEESTKVNEDEELFRAMQNANSLEKSGLSDSPFRKQRHKFEGKEDIEKLTKWWSERFTIPLEIVKNIVNTNAHGYVSDMIAYVNDNAEIGTGYHEAFEVVFGHFLTPEQQLSLIREARNDSYFKDKIELQKELYKDKSESTIIKEAIAEEYRDFVLDDGKGIRTKYKNNKKFFVRLKRFFDNVREFFNKLIGRDNKGRNNSEIEKIFNKISSGYYKNAIVVNTEYYAEKAVSKGNGEFFDEDFSNELMKNLNHFFFNNLFQDATGEQMYNIMQEEFTVEEMNKQLEVLRNKVGGILSHYVNAYKQKLKDIQTFEKFKKSDYLEKAKEQSEILKTRVLTFNKVLEEFYKTDGAAQRFRENLATFGFEELDEDNANNDVEETERTGGRGSEYVSNASLKMSTKLSTSKVIKFMLATIPNVDIEIVDGKEIVKPRFNDYGLYETIDFNTAFGTLINKMEGTVNIDQQLQIMQELIASHPKLQWLNRLIGRLQIDKLKEGNLSKEQFLTINQFTQAFGKNRNIMKTLIMGKDGHFVEKDSNSDSVAAKIRRLWATNSLRNSKTIVNEKEFYDKNKMAEFIKYEKEWRNNYNKETKAEPAAKLLRFLGIEFSFGLEKLDDKDFTKFNKVINHFTDKIEKGTQPYLFSLSEDSNTEGNLRFLANLEAKYSIDTIENGFISADKSLIYLNTLNNAMTTTINRINWLKKTSLNKEEFYKALNDWYGFSKDNPYMAHSYLLDNLWNIDIKYEILDAVKEQDSQESLQFKDMDTPERLWLWFNRALKGTYNVLRPADNAREKFLQLGIDDGSGNLMPIIGVNDLSTNKHVKIAIGYLKDELLYRLSYDWDRFQHASTTWKNGSTMDIIRNFKDPKTKTREKLEKLLKFEGESRTKIEEKIEKFISTNLTELTGIFKSYFKNQAKALFDNNNLFSLVESELIKESKTPGKYDSLGVASDKLLLKSNTEKNLLNHLEAFAASYYISATEQMKFFIGDGMFSKNLDDFTKRTQGNQSTKELSIADKKDSDSEKQFRKLFKFVDKSEEDYDERGKPRVGILVTEDDKFFTEYNYFDNKNGDKDDGQSVGTEDYYRHHYIRNGGWNMKAEERYQWLMQKEMMFQIAQGIYTIGEWNDVFGGQDEYGSRLPIVKDGEKIVYDLQYAIDFNPRFKGKEIDINKNESKINSIKVQGFGFMTFDKEDDSTLKVNNAPLMLKTSIHVVSPRSYRDFETGEITNKNFYNFAVHARKNKYGIKAAYSAVKGKTHIKQENGKDVPLYNMNPKTKEEIENNNWNFKNGVYINKLGWEFVGNQLATGFSTHKHTPNGTQFNKNIYANIYDNGIVVNEELEALVNEGDRLNNLRMKVAQKGLIERLGLAKDSEGNYITKDTTKLVNSLLREAKSRGAADNVVDAINLLRDTKGLKGLPVEAVLSKTSVEYILHSLVDKDTIGRPLTGKPSYQVSSSGFEKNIKILERNGKKYVASGDLKCYEPTMNSEGEITKVKSMEVMIPSIYKGIVEIGQITDERLLTLIGFRIPTQAMSSIESIIIKDFLPDDYGDVVVVPAEIVLKAGSDFDIDKLNIFAPNVYKNENGRWTYIDKELTYKNYIRKSLQFINKGLNKVIGRTLLVDITKNIEDLYSGKSLKETGISDTLKVLEEIKNELDNITTVDIREYKAIVEDILSILNVKSSVSTKVDRLLSQNEFELLQIENQMLDNWNKIITHPANFKQLVTSVEAESLKNLKLVNMMLNSNYLTEAQLIRILKHKRAEELLIRVANTWSKSQDKVFNLNKIVEITFANDMSKQNMEGAGTIGIVAIASTFLIHGQRNGLFLNNKNVKIVERDSAGNAYTKSKDITINLPHVKVNGIPSLGAIKDAYGNYISTNFSKAMTATVDNAKEAILGWLNWGMKNFSTAMMLMHIGVPEAVLNTFFNQPIIKYFNQLQEVYESPIQMVNGEMFYKDKLVEMTLKKFGGKLTNNVITESNYSENIADLTLNQFKYKGNDIDSYIKWMNKEGNERHKNLQLSILNDYLNYQHLLKYYSQATQSIKYDTKAPKTIVESMFQQLLTNKVLLDGVIGNYGKLVGLKINEQNRVEELDINSKEFEKGFIAPYRHIRSEHVAMLSQFFTATKIPVIKSFFENIINTYNDLLINTPQERAFDILNRFKGELITYFMMTSDITIQPRSSMSKPITFNLSDEMDGLMKGDGKKDYSTIDEMLSDSNLSIPKKVLRIKQALENPTKNEFNSKLAERYNNNQLIRDLEVFVRKGDIDNLKLSDTLTKDTIKLNTLTSYWRELFKDNNTFGLDLMKFVIMQSGINPSPINFIYLAPAEEYNKLFRSVISTLEGKNESDIANNLQLAWNLHKFAYPYNKDLVPRIRKKDGNLKFKPKKTEVGVNITPLGIRIERDEKTVANDFSKSKFILTMYNLSTMQEIPYEFNEWNNNKGKVPYSKDMVEAIKNVSSIPNYTRKDEKSINVIESKQEISQNSNQPLNSSIEYTPENITSLKPNEVFVFGANTAGGHGGGTAGLAQRGTTSSNYTALPIGTKGKWSEYGVVDKLMQGTEGKSFGIVTKAASINGTSLKIGSKRSVPLSRIGESINKLIETANQNPNLKFLVTKFGTNMAGFTIEEMKSLLVNKNLPDNIVLPKEFEVRDFKSSKKINILKNEKNGFERLSNLALSKFTDTTGREYYSVEHAYQTWKSGNFNSAIYNNKDWAEGDKKISDATKANTKINVQLMKSLIKASLVQNPWKLELLLSTGNAELTHDNNFGDNFWGNKGNKFGELLMELREELRNSNSSTKDSDIRRIQVVKEKAKGLTADWLNKSNEELLNQYNNRAEAYNKYSLEEYLNNLHC